ncbi:MAG: UbiX family flavin prenyltransferase [Planctomycetales bacterium]|nr:UbiX family flavin prenyltransferase [Planctomycetales bacterium]
MTSSIQTSDSSSPIVLAVTGASGAIYATSLLEQLLACQIPVHFVVSQSGRAVMEQELGYAFSEASFCALDMFSAADRFLQLEAAAAYGPASVLRQRALQAINSGRLSVHAENNYMSPIASGSFLTRAMVVCPCSGSTLSAMAHSANQNLIQRAAEVHLKERRPLIVVPRETPLSSFCLENMFRLSQSGVVVLPAAPGWYHGVSHIHDLVLFIVGRILDQLGIRHECIRRWAED